MDMYDGNGPVGIGNWGMMVSLAVEIFRFSPFFIGFRYLTPNQLNVSPFLLHF